MNVDPSFLPTSKVVSCFHLLFSLQLNILFTDWSLTTYTLLWDTNVHLTGCLSESQNPNSDMSFWESGRHTSLACGYWRVLGVLWWQEVSKFWEYCQNPHLSQDSGILRWKKQGCKTGLCFCPKFIILCHSLWPLTDTIECPWSHHNYPIPPIL